MFKEAWCIWCRRLVFCLRCKEGHADDCQRFSGSREHPKRSLERLRGKYSSSAFAMKGIGRESLDGRAKRVTEWAE